MCGDADYVYFFILPLDDDNLFKRLKLQLLAIYSFAWMGCSDLHENGLLI